MTKASLQAGAAQVNITPVLGTRINGDFISHYATHIHDHLFSRALVLKEQQTTVAMVVVDTCIMSEEFIQPVKERITASTGILPNNILISSTHTHAAGAVEEVHLGGLDAAYREKLPGLIVQSVEDALQRLQPAKIAFGRVDVPRHVVCRRYLMKDGYQPANPVTGKADIIKTNPFGLEKFIDRPAATPDPGLSYLAVRTLDDRWISILANYSLHYVGDWINGTITADFFGTFSRHLAAMLDNPDNFIAIMTNGTSGDVNIWDFQHPDRYPDEHFAKSDLIGKDLAGSIRDNLDSLAWDADPEIQVRHEQLTLSTRKPSPGELSMAADLVSQSNYYTYRYDDWNLRKLYAREQMLLEETPDQRTLPLQIIRIGDGMIGALPGEFFAETGLSLREHCPAAHYFSIGLANGAVGYVPPAHELERGGYETWRCRYSCLEKEADDKVRKRMLALMHSL